MVAVFWPIRVIGIPVDRPPCRAQQEHGRRNPARARAASQCNRPEDSEGLSDTHSGRVSAQNATLAPSATKRLTVASPIPDAPPVTAATLPSSLPIFATFHRIAERAPTIRRIHPAGTALLARPGA